MTTSDARPQERAEPAERRVVATVMKADISGSTPLGERLDPEDLRAVLGSYFAALAREIHRHGGLIDKYIGDAVLAVFGPPDPRADDAERAVLAGVAMQEAIARENVELERKHGVRLACRIGIATGEVVVGALAGEAQAASTVVGESVRQAEQLEAAASLGAVLVGQGTRLAAADAFRFAEPVEIVPKTGGRPLAGYRVLGLRRVAEHHDAATPSAHPGSSASLQVSGERAHVLAEERKVVTVLFADISTSEPLEQRLTPERLRAVLGAYFGMIAREIQRFGGTIDKYVGDAVMAVFGAPVSHEDDGARAIGAALAIQRAARPLNERLEREDGVRASIRIGVNTGEVVAGLLPGEVVAYTVTGDAVNTAQRIESATPPGAVLVSESTRALARNAFVFEAVAPLTLKGKAEPVPAYRVVRPERRASLRGGTTIVGRERELARLFAHWREAAAGRGQVVHVHGEAGVGKTRLVAELLAGIPSDATRVRARATSYEQATPYALVADVVRRLFSVPADEDERTARAALGTGMALAEASSRDAAVTVLLEILGYNVRSPLDPEGKRRLIVSVLRTIVERRAEAAPLVLLVEDLHWKDASSGAVVAEVAAAVPRLRCLLLTTAREAADVAWPAEMLALGALDAADTETMVDRLAAGPLDAATRALVLERTAGNPFFIEEVMRSLREGKAHAVPATVQDLLEARLDALDAAPRRVAQGAAVIGRTFSKRVLARVVGDQQLDPALVTLERRRFVDQVAVLPEPTYSFPHALVHEVVYRTQLIVQRRRTHVVVGDAFTELFGERLDEFVDTLAFHYRNGDDDPKARTWLLRAGRRAQRLYANAEALDYFVGCIERSADDPATRADAQESVGDVERVIGRYDDALAAYADALRVRPETEVVERARLRRKRANVEQVRGRTDVALDEYQRVLNVLPADASGERARTLQAIGEVCWREGRYEDAIARLSEAVEHAERAGDDDARAEALKQLGTAHVQRGDFAAATRYYEQSLALYERIGDLLGQGNMHNNLGAVARRESRLDDAGARYERARAIRERIGDQAGLVLANSNLGEIAFLRGALEVARRHYETAVGIARSIGFGMGLAVALTGAGATKVQLDEAGEGDAGRRDLLEALEEMERTGNRAFLVEVLRDTAQAHLRSDAATALSLAQRALGLAEELGSSERLGIALQALGQAREASGDVVGAIEALERSRTMLEPGAERQEFARTIGALGRLYRGLPHDDPRRLEAERLMERARSILRELGAALDLRRLDESTGGA